jgi:hypothetical protein
MSEEGGNARLIFISQQGVSRETSLDAEHVSPPGKGMPLREWRAFSFWVQ